jgi:hypothetical protein
VKKLRILENRTDVPPMTRIKWLDALNAIFPKWLGQIRAARVKLKAQAKEAKYPIFFEIEPILQFLRSGIQKDLAEIPISDLLDLTIIAIRVSTLLRCSDLSHVSWSIFEHDQQFFIRVCQKSGGSRSFCLQGFALLAFVAYLHRHRDFPAIFAFRRLRNPSECVGAE